jgi:hypothetical protein
MKELQINVKVVNVLFLIKILLNLNMGLNMLGGI